MNEEELEERSKAFILLQKLKAQEKKTRFHKEQLNNNTVVYCKNRDNLRLYKQLFNKSKR